MSQNSQHCNLSKLISGQNSPGRVLVLGSDMIFELAEEASVVYKQDVSISLHGSDRVIKFPNWSTSKWLNKHFEKIDDR